mmetsp:Transcript_5288/g.12724  ORF Transcript_5288/g.12724 Transcript_5288/m.12724 type:complete len:294 (-) Transcript_5288:282-1163(-)
MPLFLDHFLRVLEQLFELEGLFGDEADVDHVGGQRGVHGDEPAFAAHELDDADALVRVVRLDQRAVDHLHSLANGGVEAKGLVDERDVIVDRLRHSAHRHRHFAARSLLRDDVRAHVRPVSPDHIHLVDSLLLQRRHDLLQVMPPPRGSKNRTAPRVDMARALLCELHPVQAVEPFVPELDPPHIRHVVAVAEGEGDALNHVIKTRTEPAARYDGRIDLSRVKVDFLLRACAHPLAADETFPDSAGGVDVDDIDDALVLADPRALVLAGVGPALEVRQPVREVVNMHGFDCDF